MQISTIRFLNLILLLVFIVLGKFHYLIYICINQVLLEVLNRQSAYKKHAYLWYNAMFWAFELVLVERLRHFTMHPILEWCLNSMEHLAFAVIISCLLYILIALLWIKNPTLRIRRAWLVALIFNTIGIINEWNQNWLGNRPVFTLIADSKKDLWMNLIGTIVFMSIMYWRNRQKAFSNTFTT